jgi:hypothetical protein
MYERLNNKSGCDPWMCTALVVLFDTNGVHKGHIWQNQNFFFRPSFVVTCTVENIFVVVVVVVVVGGTNRCVIRYTKHGLCADCTYKCYTLWRLSCTAREGFEKISMNSHTKYVFNIHGSVLRSMTQYKYQQDAACNRIYYSKVYWRLNMFRAAHRSSSGALNCICSLWFIYPCGERSLTTTGHHMGI